MIYIINLYKIKVRQKVVEYGWPIEYSMILKSMLSIIYKNFTILNNIYIIFELCIVYLFNIYT